MPICPGRGLVPRGLVSPGRFGLKDLHADWKVVGVINKRMTLKWPDKPLRMAEAREPALDQES